MCVVNLHCPGIMISVLTLLLSVYATKTISFIGIHIFMGPMRLVFQDLSFFIVFLMLSQINCSLFDSVMKIFNLLSKIYRQILLPWFICCKTHKKNHGNFCHCVVHLLMRLQIDCSLFDCMMKIFNMLSKIYNLLETPTLFFIVMLQI